MTKKIIISIAIVALVGVGGYFALNKLPGAGSEVSGEAVARVNGKEISRTEFESQIASTKQLLAAQGVNTEDDAIETELKTQVLDQMIASALIDQEIEKLGLSVTEDQVEGEFTSIVENIGGEAAFEQQLAGAGISVTDLREDIKRQLLVNQYLSSRISEAELTVTDEEIKTVYDAASAEGEVPPLEEVREEIRATLVQQKSQQKVSELVASLRAEAEVEILL